MSQGTRGLRRQPASSRRSLCEMVAAMTAQGVTITCSSCIFLDGRISSVELQRGRRQRFLTKNDAEGRHKYCRLPSSLEKGVTCEHIAATDHHWESRPPGAPPGALAAAILRARLPGGVARGSERAAARLWRRKRW